MILLIDNYDSFTYNLYQYVCELGANCKVVRNDAITISGIKKNKPKGIILSPGPGNPDDAGISLTIILEFGSYIPILGICLGHQAIGQAYGATVGRARRMMHGKVSEITHSSQGVFEGLPPKLQVTRYHSLEVKKGTVPDCLDITAQTSDGGIMGLKHKSHPVQGLQFHPESIHTPDGKPLLANFLKQGGCL